MKAVIFDLDGTLVHSLPDIHAAVNQMLTNERQAQLGMATVQSFVGNGLPKLVERVMARQAMDMAQFDRIAADVLGIYQTATADLSQPYLGMEEALKVLQAAGYKMGVCSNKPHGPAIHLLMQMGLDGYFDVVIGGDSTKARKPDPFPLQETVRALGADQVMYVGDSEIDADTAVAASVTFALFTEGYRKRAVVDIPHQYAFANFAQLPDIVSGYFQS
ncbi:phosphoglycolate phosphatase [Shimia gijangensis]|uniref:phosphoglycolate phosphatase n=1 Tax=Shimia gijangensis TaxID=1470563 RepID=A0A1M6DTT4_9RHOB|nr:phosphoglycolate phosphatase [Shimia gijangensis]SHI76438.1 phosphoglycolate phosphatase [Shimia gijangensis]